LELYENAKKDIMSENPGISEKVASQMAGEQADRFILANKAMIISDAFALSGISKTLSRGRNPLKERNLKTFANNFKKFSRENPIAQASAESLEEIYQNTIQQEGEYQARKDAGVSSKGESANPFSRLVEFATSDKALLEGMMGFFGGPIQYGIIQHPFTLVDRKGYQEQYDAQQDQIKANPEGRS
jgi:hypothetical protein